MISNLLKFKADVVKQGDFISEVTDKQCLITFGVPVPNDLEPFCLSLDNITFTLDINVADIIYINNQKYTISALGTLANQSLKELGHISIYFDAATEALLPGSVHVSEALEVTDFSSIEIKST